MSDKVWNIFVRSMANMVEQGANSQQVLQEITEKLEKAFSLEFNRTALAEATSVSLPYISRIFSGKQRPSLTMVRKLSKLLGVTSDEFCDYLGINGVHLREYRRKDG